jgi:hypothetical protein
MSNNFKANPINAPLITRPGESKEYVGTRNVTDLLPEVFKTTVNKSFLDSTLEHLMSTGSLQAVNGFVGEVNDKKSLSENYVTDSRANLDYQFSPGIVNKDVENNVTGLMTYDDLLNAFAFNEAHIDDPSTIFNEAGHTLDLPINYDMFVNYHKYFWLVDNLPVIDIIPSSTDPITIDNIQGKFEYTTPLLEDNTQLVFKNGMRVRFAHVNRTQVYQTVSSNTTFTSPISNPSTRKVYLNNQLQTQGTDYITTAPDTIDFVVAPAVGDEIEIWCYWADGANFEVDNVYIVDGVGTESGIKLIEQFQAVPTVENYGDRTWFNQTIYSGRVPTPFDGDNDSFEFTPYDLRELVLQEREYTVEQRWSEDQSAWARGNLWVKEDVVNYICDYLNVDVKDYANDKLRAVRPIIEFRANIEKYNFGKRHITNVDYVLEKISNPATDIVGQTSFNIADYLINDPWLSKGYNKGDLVKVTMEGEVTYWDCTETHSDPNFPVTIESRKFWRQVFAKNIEDNDLIMFVNSDNAAYNNKIFKVSGAEAGNLSLIEVYNSDGSNSATALQDGDKVLCVNGYNAVFYDSYDGLVYSGSEWYWNGSTWVYGQQKDFRNAGILFQLYDNNQIELQNSTVYPNSTFSGDYIFDYGKSNNSKIDEGLGFSPRYVDYGNTPGLSFDIGLGQKRYEYNAINTNVTYQAVTDTNTVNEISGLYYYKDLNTGHYKSGWSLIRGGQPLKIHARKIVKNSSTPVVVNLGTTDYNVDDKYRFVLRNDNINVYSENTLNSTSRSNLIEDYNPTLFFSKDRTYYIQTQFDISDLEFVDYNGNALTNITYTVVDDYNATLIVDNASTDKIIKYRRASDNSVFGFAYINSETNHTNIKVLLNGDEFNYYTLSGKNITIDSEIKADDIIDVYWYAEKIDNNSDGKRMIADTHIYNPQNAAIDQVSFGDIQEHIKQQMSNMPGFTGNYFGINNYVDLPKVHQFGGTIRKQTYSTELVAQSLIDTDTNVFNSIKYVANSYRKFKTQFLNKARQLHRDEPIETPVHELVDKVLQSMNIGKNKNSSFARSQMAMFKDYQSVEYTWTTGESQVFNLPFTVNKYDDTFNHIQAWVKDVDASGVVRWRNLLKGVDYTLSQNKLTLLSNVTFDTNDRNRAYIHIRWYSLDSVSFIPLSAVKLGVLRPYQPSLEIRDVESTGNAVTNCIIGHDGSVHIRGGSELYNRSSVDFNVEDAALWELELRIYNNLNSELDNIIDYKEIMPNAHRPTTYNWDSLKLALESEFKKYIIRNKLTTVDDLGYYDPLNAFTWNFKTVGPGIGGWRALYTYYFNTDRPHTHPWEMFGYNKKPTWWDANYSWTDASKRAALIESLKTGRYNNPTTVAKYSIHYQYANYNWDSNTLVTTAGVLNNPVDANVVSSPTSMNAEAQFVYGDWGPIEFEWIRTSEFKVLLTLALLKIKPLWITTNYFNSLDRIVLDNTASSVRIISKLTGDVSNAKNLKFSHTSYGDSIIERIDVKNGGTGYTSAPEITIYGNFGQNAQALAIVENSSITAVSVTNPGSNYQSKPTVVTNDLQGKFEVSLLRDAKRYFVGLNTAISEYAKNNNSSIENIAERFNNISYQPIIKTGGFINPNNQQFVLESSQGKGKVKIPEENFSSVLHLSQPIDETFLSGIAITKLSNNGWKVSGFDDSLQYFEYLRPVTGSRETVVNFENGVTVSRYQRHEDTSTKVYYDSKFTNFQDLYSFVLGYGEYLKTKGWVTEWRATANAFGIESTKMNIGDTFICIPSTSSFEIKDGDRGYYDSLQKRYDGVYNLVDIEGKQILPNNVIVTRPTSTNEDAVTSLIVKSNDTKVYGIRFYKVELEHVIVLENKTNFSDVLYDPALGQRHKRIIWRGSRTKDWNGKLYSPGFIVTGNTITNNFDTTAGELERYFENDSKTLSNSQMVDTARFNTGYNKPGWSKYTTLDDDTVFNFVQGTRKYKGTKFALDAFMRNTSILGSAASADLYEMWAIRTADFGDIRSRNTVEFQLNEDLLRTSPQVIRFNEDDTNDLATDDVIDIDPASPLLVTGESGNNFQTRPAKKYNVTTLAGQNVYDKDFIVAGLPLVTETNYRVLNRTDFEAFPVANKSAYNFYGDWRLLQYWNNRLAYKFNDKVIYEGNVWKMRDPDGSSGLQRPNDPIVVIGSQTLPFIPSDGQTLIVDGTTVNITKTEEAVTLNAIQITGTRDIQTTSVVPHGSSIVLGATSGNNQTITFENVVNDIIFQNIVKTGTVTNPTITGSLTKELIIDGFSVNFNDTVSATDNILASVAFANQLSSAGINSISGTQRISTISALREAYKNEFDNVTARSFFNDYYATGTGGLNWEFLVAEYNNGFSSAIQVLQLLSEDIAIINTINNTSFDVNNVIAGTETILNTQRDLAIAAMQNTPYDDEISNWLQFAGNDNTVLTATTVIATETTSGFRVYELSDIVDKINSAGIPFVTASQTIAGNLVITKTTNAPETQFSLVISAASANTDVGFASTTQRINSTGQTVLTTPDLSLSQVIEQINDAGIPNITALSIPNTGQLQIVSTGSTLYIGPGSANTVIGLPEGIVPATQTITTITSSSGLSDIVTSINNAGISGITASNSNNRLLITSVNSTLTIGEGTANVTVGLTAQTYQATSSTIENTFNKLDLNGDPIFEKVENDPHLFNIWVADNSYYNSDTGDFDTGYDVYQTMNFGFYITKACVGIEEADEAMIMMGIADSGRTAHNLSVGDYVLISGSTTKPSIDGVHKVTKLGDSSTGDTFFIDAYINEEGYTGNIYPLRSVRFSSFADLESNYNSTTASGTFRYNFAGNRLEDDNQPIYAYVDDDGTGYPAVYRFDGYFAIDIGHVSYEGWRKVRQAPDQARNDLLENVKIYDAINRTLITTLETYDPAKGIIPGFIADEIEFKTSADVAVYNYTSIDGFNENQKAWTDEEVGKRWWDLSTSIYLDYEQGGVDYQQNYWGKLFDGATVDIYEWTRSPVLPENWNIAIERGIVVDGNVASGEPYTEIVNGETVYYWTEKTFYNPTKNQTETMYYFWVKNKSNFAGVRNYNVYQLSNLLLNLDSLGISWCAASEAGNLLLSNVESFLTNDTVVQVNQVYESNSLPMSEWTLLAENDEDTIIPEYMHIKIRDSIAGFNNNSVLYDYRDWNTLDIYNKDQVVVFNDVYYISNADNNLGNQPDISTQTYWSKIYKYELPDSTQGNDILVWRGNPLPDLKLHEFNRYGHLTRPNQTLYRDLTTARHNFVETLNSIMDEICIVNEINNWNDYLNSTFVEGEVTYDLSNYWVFKDWVRQGYDINIVPDVKLSNKDDISPTADPVVFPELNISNGSYIYIENVIHEDGVNRPEIYKKENNEYIIVWKKEGTIEFSEELWNQEKFGLGFDVVGFDITGFDQSHDHLFARLFDIIKNHILINQHRRYYNTLWFKCLYQAIIDNTADDFAFKTTFAKLKVDHPLLTNKERYDNHSTTAIEEYFNSIKPFHTKLLGTLQRPTVGDGTNVGINETQRDFEITLAYRDHSERTWNGDAVVLGGTFDNDAVPYISDGYVEPGYFNDNILEYQYELTSEFTTADVDFVNEYNGNIFVQPREEGWGDEIYPIDFTENVNIMVQTNTSGSTEDLDTRTFRMSYFFPQNVQENTVKVDANVTQLAADIDAVQTEITVVDTSVLSDPQGTYNVAEQILTPKGVVYINNERIEYGAIDGNTLKYCVRGTHGTSAQAHSQVSEVVDSSWNKLIPNSLDNFAHYGDGLRMAFNETGISLSVAGNTPEHVFIRNAGSGTI